MTAFWGWAGVETPSPKAADVAARVAVNPGSVGTAGCQFSGPSCFLAGEAVGTFQDGGACVMIAGRPRWLGGETAHNAQSVARLALQAYRASGVSFLSLLGGTFALTLTVDAGHTHLLAIDRMGVWSIAYHILDRGIVFGTSCDLVNDLLDEPRELDPQSLLSYAFFHMVPGPSTIYARQSRIPPGGYVMLRDGRIEEGRYWRMKYEEVDGGDLPGLAAEFRGLLERSVIDELNGRVTGAFLSGGTDSSTVTGVLAKVSGAPARSYSIGFDAQGYDEIEYARIAARHFATEHHEYYVTPADVCALLPRLAQSCDQPFGNASIVPTYYCARLAGSDGVQLLLAGDGGDELFGGNERYATQAMLSWYGRVPSALREFGIEPALGLPWVERVPLLRKARGYVKQASLAVPERLHAYNLLRRNPIEDVFTPEFLSRVDPSGPLATLHAVYADADAQSELNRILALDLQFTLADNDLYKVNTGCRLAGVEVAYPLLSDRMVAFSATLPAGLKLKGTKLRYFFKRALKDFLPEAIIKKRKHGFGLPIGVWMRSDPTLQSTTYEALHALGARGMVRTAFIDRLTSEHRSGHAAYWGGEIWVLSQLELWLQAHGWAAGRPLV
ncbi:MAG TPA: asparagine synthase-related protein [Casimicrobiaceae bacterium]|nr:asparagine synthase-related protein [Casimicrobiaceae bacterium]